MNTQTTPQDSSIERQIAYNGRLVLAIQAEKYDGSKWINVPGFIIEPGSQEKPDATYFKPNATTKILIKLIPKRNRIDLEQILRQQGFEGPLNIWKPTNFLRNYTNDPKKPA